MAIDKKQMQWKLHQKIRKSILKAISTFWMIENWDKILLWISWWKDSMLLAKMLCELRDYSHLNFEIKWVHIHREFVNETIDFKQFLPFFEKIWLEVEIFPMKVPDGSRLSEWMDMSCQRCSYARRITLFKLCEQRWYNKIALWHHLDDAVTTLFMNLINNRNWSLMPPINRMKKWDLTIIRLMSFVREIDIIHLVKKEEIPFLTWACPIWDKSRRKDIWNLTKLIEEKEEKSIENIYFGAVKEFIKCYKDKNRITD